MTNGSRSGRLRWSTIISTRSSSGKSLSIFTLSKKRSSWFQFMTQMTTLNRQRTGAIRAWSAIGSSHCTRWWQLAIRLWPSLWWTVVERQTNLAGSWSRRKSRQRPRTLSYAFSIQQRLWKSPVCVSLSFTETSRSANGHPFTSRRSKDPWMEPLIGIRFRSAQLICAKKRLSGRSNLNSSNQSLAASIRILHPALWL